MSKSIKKTDFVKSRLNAKKLCPHCGHENFKTIPTRFSWLFGQTFVCLKCKGTFKKAVTGHPNATTQGQFICRHLEQVI